MMKKNEEISKYTAGLNKPWSNTREGPTMSEARKERGAVGMPRMYDNAK